MSKISAVKPTVQDSPVGKTHDQWLSDILPRIEESQKMLEDQLSVDASEQSAQATLTEDAYRAMTEILAQAKAWIRWYEYTELMRLDRNAGTASERKVIINYKLINHEMFHDKIDGLCKALYSRMRRAQWQS